MLYEWFAIINGKYSCSEGALFQCEHCKCNAWYWIGYWPYCTSGHDQRVCPYNILEEFDQWFDWQLRRRGIKEEKRKKVNESNRPDKELG